MWKPQSFLGRLSGALCGCSGPEVSPAKQSLAWPQSWNLCPPWHRGEAEAKAWEEWCQGMEPTHRPWPLGFGTWWATREPQGSCGHTCPSSSLLQEWGPTHCWDTASVHWLFPGVKLFLWGGPVHCIHTPAYPWGFLPWEGLADAHGWGEAGRCHTAQLCHAWPRMLSLPRPGAAVSSAGHWLSHALTLLPAWEGQVWSLTPLLSQSVPAEITGPARHRHYQPSAFPGAAAGWWSWELRAVSAYTLQETLSSLHLSLPPAT